MYVIKCLTDTHYNLYSPEDAIKSETSWQLYNTKCFMTVYFFRNGVISSAVDEEYKIVYIFFFYTTKIMKLYVYIS